MKIVFITVSYNNFKSTKDYIHSFLSLSNLSDVKLMVVDNSTLPDSQLKQFICELSTDIIYCRQNENKGYMSACNFGYKQVKSYLDRESVVIYSNNDLVFNTADTCERVRYLFSKNKNLGVLSPKVIDFNSQAELNPFLVNRPSKFSLIKLRLLFSSYYVCKLFYALKKSNKKRVITSNSTEIYATHGCVFILSNKLLDCLPDDEYFLYGEEVTIAELSKKLGFITMYEDNICVSHVSHSTTGIDFSRFQFDCKKNALKHIWRKYSW
jgi:GT2 family glycosyltransferase